MLVWMPSRRWCACVPLTLAVAGGCAAPWSTSYLAGSRQQDAALAESPADPNAAAFDPKATALRKANGQQPATSEEALADVLDELHEIGAIDPAAQQELMADLKAAKPEHYGLIVTQFRAALSYQQQLARRDREDQAQLASDEREPADSPAPRARSVARTARRTGAVRVVGPAADEQLADAAPAAEDAQLDMAAATIAGDGADRDLRQASAAAGLDLPPTVLGDWRTGIGAAIADLEKSVEPQPATIADLHDHLRLRALLILAGRDDEAYRPIPGASPAQQDYWSKQLFAMATYLNNAATVDDKQRAAAALVHLNEAQAALAQLATLQIRREAFVTSVDGYGAYEPLKHAEFPPGAQATVYLEVENFGSESTAAGYETALGTSYQVLDATGRRVEGGQFPDVKDLCRSRRRDFHLQYGVGMPTGIALGEYRLELTITDLRTGKIGQSTLPFEIVGQR